MSTLSAIHQKTRRSSRLNQAIPLTIEGADASRTPYREHVSTLTVSCHGCKYRAKNKPSLGDLVLLALEGSERRSASARVKHVVQLGTNENPFEVVLELESPGNIWALPSPPEDWFPAREGAADAPPAGIRVLPRNEAQIVSMSPGTAESAAIRPDALGSASPFLAQFMLGLNEQIRVIASDAAMAAIAKEKGRLLDEFRTQLRSEARETLEQAIVVARENAGSKVLQELNAAHETAARSTYERWTKKLEQDFAETAQRSVSLGSKVNERVEKSAATIAERLQQTLDASRREAVDQFRARLRTEIAPLVEEAQSVVQQLVAFQEDVKVKSLEICGQFSDFLKEEALKSAADVQQKVSECDRQITGALQERVSKGTEELEKRFVEATGTFDERLQRLCEEREHAAQDRLKSLAESNANEAVKHLQGKIAELSTQFSNEMDNYRNYLQLISTSIGEIAKRPSVRAQE